MQGLNLSTNIQNAKYHHETFSYIGTTYINSYYSHYAPNSFELKAGIWSKNILVHDIDSLNEMQFKLQKNSSEYKIN